MNEAQERPYVGFKQASEDFAEDPTCRCCKSGEDVIQSSLIGVVCRPCHDIWIDAGLTEFADIIAYRDKAKAEGAWPFKAPANPTSDEATSKGNGA